MNKVHITRRFGFEACDHLPGYNGKCANVHGHSYKLEVTVSACRYFDDSPRNGGNMTFRDMVMDFVDLKHIVNNFVIDRFDHKDLNEFFVIPTAENMVVRIYEIIAAALRESVNAQKCKVSLEEVKLWETEDSYATYRGEKT